MSTAGREVPAGFKTILLDRGKKLVFPHNLSFFLVSPPMSFASKQTAKASRKFFLMSMQRVFLQITDYLRSASMTDMCPQSTERRSSNRMMAEEGKTDLQIVSE